MSTLGIKKQAIVYLLISLFCSSFGIVYEHFSHGVNSYYMMYSFLIPLIGGFILSLILKKNFNKYYHASLATFIVGSYLKGVLEIYGTTNNLINVYFIVGIILFILSILKYHNSSLV